MLQLNVLARFRLDRDPQEELAATVAALCTS